MSHSSRYKRILATPPWAAHDALDARTARVVISNLMHHADQSCARVLASWVLPSGLAKGHEEPFATWTPAYLGRICSIGPLPISAYEGLRAYSLRVRILGSSGLGTSTIGVTASAALMPAGVSAATIGEPGTVAVTSSSSTPAWLAAVPSDLVTLSPGALAAGLSDEPTLTWPGGDPAAARQYLVTLHVWGSEHARLHGIHIAEYHDD